MPKSSAERMWLVGGVIAAFLLLLIGYFLFISPQRASTADLESQAVDATTQNSTLQSHIDALRKQSLDLPKYQADLAAAQQALPSTSGLSDFLRTLQTMGSSTLTDVSSLTVGPPTDVSGVAAGTTPAAGSTASASPAATPSGSAPAGTTAAATPGQGGGVYGLAITAQVTGSPAALDKFLSKLQTVQPRAVLITALTEGTSGDSTGAVATTAKGATTLQLTMQAFVAPTSATEQQALSAASHK